MTDTQRSTVVGVFEDHQEADRAVEELRRAGFGNEQIGVVAPDPNKGDATATEKGSKAAGGAITGAIAGAGVGGLVGLGILAGVIPVIGPVIAGGTLAVILANAAGGAAIAGLVGALVGLGIPEEEAHHYEGEFEGGSHHRHGQGPQRALRPSPGHSAAARGYNKDTPKVTASNPPAAARSTSGGRVQGGQTMQLREEELHARKQPVQTGEVRVRKEVVTENKTLEVPVQREEVVIERHPVAGGASSGSDMWPGEEVRIPVKESRSTSPKRRWSRKKSG